MPPAAPTKAPVAHPLAPNPNTSIGLFWIYTDPTTGRQSTAVTYKVKRCTGSGCTPTTVIASGLTTADYQDTGLSANTTYTYSFVANDGSDSADSPTVEVTTSASDDNMVHFPSTVWENLLGPQPETSLIPFAWYNSTANSVATTLISKYPIVGPSPLKGTGSINNGSTSLTGSASFFLEQVSAGNPTNLDHIAINGVDAGTIASVNSNTSITLTTPWAGTNQSGVALSTNVPLGGFADPLNDYLVGNQLMYYDSPMALWQLYFRTGDPQYLRGAIKGSESIFAGYMWLGRNRAWNGYSTTPNADNMPAPRNFQFSGYVLLGLAGHDGVWDLLDDYLTNRYPTWIANYRGGNNDFTYTREKAYTILFTSWFVMAAPDSFPRSDGTVTSLNGATTVDGSLATGRKGHWRDELNTDLPGFITDDQLPYGIWMESDAAADRAEDDYPYAIGGKFQPFIGGLLGDALGYCWRASALSSTARDAARKLVLRLTSALAHLTYNKNVAADDPSIRWRTVHYFNGKGHRLNPYCFEYGVGSSILNDTPDPNLIAQYRQAIPLMLSTFGWAYEMSGQSSFKTMGDEMANAAFAEIGENTGATGDGKKCLADAAANYKDFGQAYRTSGRYFGHRLASPSLISTPPSLTMPSNVTLSNGVNQVSLTALVSASNNPCTYRWFLEEYPLANFLDTSSPVFYPDDQLSTLLCGLESGVYKVGFYVMDSLGMEDHGTVNVTVGDGVFPPVAVIGSGSVPSLERHVYLTTSSSVSASVKAFSAAGRSLSHSFSAKAPKDKSAPTITPSGTTGNSITLTISGLSAGLWIIKDTVTDSAGASRKVQMYIRHTSEAQPSSGHNTIPDVAMQPNHVLGQGSTSTKLYAVPLDPEGIVGYASPATGYTLGFNGGAYLVTALTHSWAQISGPATATITNGNTLRPEITNMTVPGVYTFRYTGTDPQGDSITADVSVTTQASNASVKLIAICL